MSHYGRYSAYKDSSVGWIGKVPEHWSVCKLNYRYSVELGKMLDQKKVIGHHLFPYLRNQDVQWGSISTEGLPQMDVRPNEMERYTVLDGDLLVCEGGDVGRAAVWHGNPIVYQKALHRLRPRRDDQTYFMYYTLIAAKWRGAFSESDSKSTISHLPAEVFRAYSFTFPPADEQRAIVIALDRETARIDALIAKKTRFIQLLKEKREALIARAVTKGLDSTARMKDSGVEWIGEMPEHWEVVPPIALFTESKERARDGDELLSATQKYGVIPLAEFERLEQRQVTKAVANLEIRKHVEVGDFVISMRSMDGGLERARAIGSVRSSYSVLKPGPDVDGRFFGALLKSSLYIQALRLTSNFIRDGQDLNFSHFRQVSLPKPSLQEQAAIADHVETGTSRIDTLISKTERSITLLKERRSALITAAVTGQIDLRETA